MLFDDNYGIRDEDEEELPSLPAETSRNSIVLASQKSGWLKKQSNNVLKSWSYRYFALDGHKLYYYKQPSDKVPLGVLSFDQISCEIQAVPENSPKKLVIVPLGSSYTITVQSPNSSDLMEWFIVLSQAIYSSVGKSKNLALLGQKGKFWKHERISASEFLDKVETGDILLFRSQDIGSKIARGVIGSQYDHVAFLIKYVSGKIAMLEATNAEGVNILMWEEFVANDWHKLSSRLVIRHLLVERTDEMLIKLEEFVKKVEGKKFKISPIKLLQRNSREMPGEESGFFCSELVASAYKAMGLLSSDVPASSYWPGDFSAEKNINLIGAKLSREFLIDFEIE